MCLGAPHCPGMQHGFLSGMQNGCRLAFVPGCFGTKAPSAIADMLEHIHVCTKIYNFELTVCHSMCRAQTQVVGAYQLSVLVLPMLTLPMIWEPNSRPAPKCRRLPAQGWQQTSPGRRLYFGSRQLFPRTKMVSGIGAAQASTALPAN